LRAGPHARLVIRDTGAGMPPEMLERIFDPFFTTKPAGEGTGMGLSVVHGVVTAHHGAINVQSAIGEGTTFSVLLPIVTSSVSIGPGADDAELSAAGVVYVADDEPAIARLLATGLARYGFRTRAFDSAGALLQAVSEAPQLVDAVVTDVVMPTMSGEVLAQRLLQQRPDLVVLLLSGSAPRLDVAQGVAGVAECLLKPVGFRALARSLARHLAAHRQGELTADTGTQAA
jgi:CheY-like chemotaxis protein